jgi:hypothetical protein
MRTFEFGFWFGGIAVIASHVHCWTFKPPFICCMQPEPDDGAAPDEPPQAPTRSPAPASSKTTRGGIDSGVG